jgi:hypothetical protein
MAKRKEEITEIDQSVITESGTIDSTTTTEETPVTPTKNEKSASIEELPEAVNKILKLFVNEKELYIDKQGGVFYKHTKPALIKNAILYKNPYYHK